MDTPLHTLPNPPVALTPPFNFGNANNGRSSGIGNGLKGGVFYGLGILSKDSDRPRGVNRVIVKT